MQILHEKRSCFIHSFSFGLESISFFNNSPEIYRFGVLRTKNGGDWLMVIGVWVIWLFGYLDIWLIGY